MTQKKFRKLLMSKGYERNDINEIVENTIKSGKSYEEVYVVTAFESINISRFADAVAEAYKSIQRLAEACAQAISAAADAFYAAMKEGSENEIPK